mgnify:CR=1 FL=1
MVFEYIKSSFSRLVVSVEAINESTKIKDEEMVDDFVSIVTSFCNRIYGRNRKKNTIEIIEKIRDEDKK